MLGGTLNSCAMSCVQGWCANQSHHGGCSRKAASCLLRSSSQSCEESALGRCAFGAEPGAQAREACKPRRAFDFFLHLFLGTPRTLHVKNRYRGAAPPGAKPGPQAWEARTPRTPARRTTTIRRPPPPEKREVVSIEPAIMRKAETACTPHLRTEDPHPKAQPPEDCGNPCVSRRRTTRARW